jgi:hypothetical protein
MVLQNPPIIYMHPVFSSVVCLAHFSTLSHEQRKFWKKVIGHKMCGLSFSQICLKHFLFWEELSEISKMYIGLHVKYPLFLSDFNETWIFLIDIWKMLEYQISWKSVQWEPSCSMQTGRCDEANSHLSQFCECAWTLHIQKYYRIRIIKLMDEKNVITQSARFYVPCMDQQHTTKLDFRILAEYYRYRLYLSYVHLFPYEIILPPVCMLSL